MIHTNGKRQAPEDYEMLTIPAQKHMKLDVEENYGSSLLTLLNNEISQRDPFDKNTTNLNRISSQNICATDRVPQLTNSNSFVLNKSRTCIKDETIDMQCSMFSNAKQV